jgi:hypothetical protein
VSPSGTDLRKAPPHMVITPHRSSRLPRSAVAGCGPRRGGRGYRLRRGSGCGAGRPAVLGERQVLLVAASIAEGIPVDLREAALCLDAVNAARAAQAVCHAAGRRVQAVAEEPAGFQLRADLLAELNAPSPGRERRRVSVVHAVTGMRGTGKTQLAGPALLTLRAPAGWRVSWAACRWRWPRRPR